MTDGSPENVDGSESDGNVSEKKRLIAALLCWFVGVLGVHSFYVGRTTKGVIQLLTLGGCGLWALFDLIMILIGKETDGEGKTLTEWN